jgi:hypothetical protein
MKKRTSYVFLDNHSLLVINCRGKLRTLYTPFRVKCIIAVNHLPEDSWAVVDEVLQSESQGLIYVIQGGRYCYKHFRIHIKF